jgi:epoxide hydrolase-like predicted phosphatase
MIKAVLFDYGGVLTESGGTGTIQEIIGQLYDVDPAHTNTHELHRQFIRGLISRQEFFGELNNRFGKQKSEADWLREAEQQGFFVRSQAVYDLAAALRAAGLKTGILSNIYDMSASALRERGLYEQFDPVILSCEEKVAKPDREFFERALQKLGLPGNEVLFIDDQERFRPVAESLGMHFITATLPEQVVNEVKVLLQKENNLALK